MTAKTKHATIGFMTTSAPTVAAAFARGLVDYCASAHGVRRAALAARSGIDLSELNDSDDRVSFSRYVALMRAAQELCGDPALALHFGESSYAETSVGCVIGSFAETGAEAFALMNRYARLNVEAECAGEDRFALSNTGGQLWLVDTRTNADDFPELTELTFACLIATARRQAGDNHPLLAIHVTHPAPPYRAEYERVFRMPVVFGSDKNAILLHDDEWMTQRPPTASPLVLEILSARAEALLGNLDSAKSARGRVESLIAMTLHSGSVSVEAVARKMGVSRQTLFRRLRSEGTSFARLLDQLRHKLALHYLRDRKMAVNEAAYLVGFSDRAAFARAFKRWTGSTPRRYLA
jgi:AraC-like DNA-binding protein